MLDDRSCYSVADPEPDPKLLVGSGSEINVSDPDSVGTIKGTVRYGTSTTVRWVFTYHADSCCCGKA